MRTREELLEKIIQYEDPAQLLQLKRELDKNYGWDGDEDLVQLTRDNIVSMLSERGTDRRGCRELGRGHRDSRGY